MMPMKGSPGGEAEVHCPSPALERAARGGPFSFLPAPALAAVTVLVLSKKGAENFSIEGSSEVRARMSQRRFELS